MKKKTLYLLTIILLVSCSTKIKKPEQRSRFLKGFYTQYNTLFNAENALNSEFDSRKTSYKDNFYAPYIPILTYEEQPLGSDLGQSAAFAENASRMAEINDKKKIKSNTPLDAPPGGLPGGMNVGSVIEKPKNTNEAIKTTATTLEIAEAKAQKAINKYSVIRKDAEKNKAIFDAYIILAQSRIYQGKPLKAIDALQYLFSHMKDDKRIPLAEIYEGLAYAKLKDYHKAEEIFSKIKENKLAKNDEKLLLIFSSEALLDAGKKQEAVEELNKAFEKNNNRVLKSRIAYLRGQVLQELNQNDKARESFLAAYKYANDFEFEVKSQIAIASTHNGNGNYKGAKKYLEDIAKKGTYASRKNEFLYALGLMANKAGKKEDAQVFFDQSLKEKISDPQIRGLSFFEKGKYLLDKNDYIGAGAYYDSALVSLTYEPSKILIKDQATNIKKIAVNYYLIKKNDSILALAKMPLEQKNSYFAAHIAQLKKKEEKEALEREKEERRKGFDTGDYNANSIFGSSGNGFQEFGTSNKGFYFASTNSVSKGVASFKQIWGERSLADNWRYSKKMASIQDLKDKALGTNSAPNPRRYEAAYYIEQIPTDTKVLVQLKKDRDTASLGIGIMYQNYFANTPLATKTLYDLVEVDPEEKVMLQALYEIFAMNYEKNPAMAEKAKQILLSKYPYSSYAEFARNPKNKSFIKSSLDTENLYNQAYLWYTEGKFVESQKLLDEGISKYPKDALLPKLYLLNALNTGKIAGKEIMILKLEQIVLNYAKTEEGIKAKELLKHIKSELKTVTNVPNNVPQNNVPQNNVIQNAVPQNMPDNMPQNSIPQNNVASPNKTVETPNNATEPKNAPNINTPPGNWAPGATPGNMPPGNVPPSGPPMTK